MDRTIIIAEDDESIRELVKMALTSFSYRAITFDNAEDALAAALKDCPDMCIFDIMLPGMSGLDATKKLRESPLTKDVPIILLTAKDTERDKVTGLDSGADDYISKPFGVMELGARIRSLLRRAGQDDKAQVLEAGGLHINTDTREVTQGGRLLDLTFKEYELLCMLMRQKNRIVPRDELLHSIWGYDFLGETRTLDIHVRTLRQKLGDDVANPRYIKTVRNVGYRFIGE